MKNFLLALSLLILVGCTGTDATPSGTPEPYAPTIFQARNAAPASPSRFNDSRPNIIFILTDDQPYESVQFMPTVHDVLVKNGVNFENGFVTTPLCCPSRVSILTGQYAHDHQVYTDRFPLGGAQKYDDKNSFSIWLQNAGYHTAYFGKYLNDYDALKPFGVVPPGWDEWSAFLGKNLGEEDIASQYYSDYSLSENGKVIEYTKDKSVFSADLLTQKAVDFISESRDNPFFLFVGYYNPHSPYFWAERDDNQFRSNAALQADAYRPPNFMEDDVSDKPKYLQDLNPISIDKIDVSYKQILRSLLSVDDGVASILSVLTKTGLDKNTIIVYLTDNGLTVGNHRLGLTKNCAYEECVRVPFIVYAPGIFPPRTDSHLVANIDLAPTFAALAGASIPDTVNGANLLPLLNNKEAPWRDVLLLEHWSTEEGVGSKIPDFYAVRNAQWKYVEYVTGETELYDLVNDPYELTNLTENPEYATMKAKLRDRLLELKKE